MYSMFGGQGQLYPRGWSCGACRVSQGIEQAKENIVGGGGGRERERKGSLDKTTIGQRTDGRRLDWARRNGAGRWRGVSARIITRHGWILLVGILAGTPSRRCPCSSAYVARSPTRESRHAAGLRAVWRVLSYAIIWTVGRIDGSAWLSIRTRFVWSSRGFRRRFCGRREWSLGG